MIQRDFWINKIEEAWERRSIVWLGGVRRVGKTSLCKSLDNVEYYNCESSRVEELVANPEEFYRDKQGKRIVLDEVQVLKDPSRLLKIGADEFPTTKIIATGSSTLGISKKFSDTLTGRKTDLHLTPILYQERQLFGNDSIDHRFLFGGLPPFFLNTEAYPPQGDFAEWLSSYFARDIQELYSIENRAAFLKFMRLVLAESGGIFEATRFANMCDVSRPTIGKYVDAAEQTLTARLISPFSSHASYEITRAPKIYCFDTGFLCFAKGWNILRSVDYDVLWEHLVLNDLIGRLQHFPIKYWRDKSGHEIDFIIGDYGTSEPVVIECKWNSAHFEAKNIQAFRKRYPHGKNFVVARTIGESFTRKFDTLDITFVSLEELPKLIRS